MQNVWFLRIARISTLLALFVVVLGAYVRLSDAGLGCPDWPGCYGHIGVPEEQTEITAANGAFPERPVETDKAWKEMVHRYFASTLGLLIVIMAVLAWRNRQNPQQPVVLPIVLVGVVIFQGMLGMWTVTLQLKPVIVMGHLLGGFTTLVMLWWLASQGWKWSVSASLAQRFRPWVLAVMGLLGVQIALGGWTSSNYAALACPDFPYCQGEWWPPMDFSEAFVMWRGLGINYEFGVLEHPARTAIHLTHRIGALVVFLSMTTLLVMLYRMLPQIRLLVVAIAALLAVQIGLGISNVVFGLPLAVASAHNGVAAVLLLSLVLLLRSLSVDEPGNNRQETTTK